MLALVIAAAAGFAAAAPAWAQSGPPPTFTKTFQPDTIGPGSTTKLQFTITNGLGTPVTALAFSDTLPAGVTIADPANASTTCLNATLTAPAGGSTISITGGEVGGASSCTVSVDVTSSTVGTHTNTSGDLTSDEGNSGTATDDLMVVTGRPGFTKSFAPDTVSLNGRSTLTFTIDNTANGALASDLTFTDNLPTGMEVAGPSNATSTCTGATITAVTGANTISLANALVAAGASCTVAVDVIGAAVGTLANATGELTSDVSASTVSSGFAVDELTVTTDPLSLTKSFVNDPTPPGGGVTLEFTVRNLDRFDSATNVAFTDDLDAALTGLAATGLPASDVCGTGSTLTGTTTLSLAGGTLAPEASCTFSVQLAVPGTASGGAYVNTTSQVSADIGGSAETGAAATDTLFIAPVPLLTKTFLDASTMLPNPVLAAGDSVIIRFGITNTSPMDTATGITFADELTTFLPFPVNVTLPPVPNPPCGGGSSLALTVPNTDVHELVLTGGTLAAGASCTFDVTLTTPSGLAEGVYTNVTEQISATVNAATVVGPAATDSFTVLEAPLLTKQFLGGPVDPGGTTTLEFMLSHDALAPANATGIAFTDDLNAALTGLTAIGLPTSNVCGAGSQISGTTNLSFTGGTLAPGASCTFSVTVQVPVAAIPGTYTNTTSTVSANVSGTPVVSNAASDDLQVGGLSFTKSFTDDPTIPGGNATLEFTIANTTLAAAAAGLTFTDDLGAIATGITSTSGTLNNICGAGSAISGVGTLSFTGGNLAAGASCTFSVNVAVPGATANGNYNNVTSSLTGTVGGNAVTIPPAVDSLMVSSDVLVLTKEFTDDPVGPGDTVTLEFNVTNMGAAAGTGITFTDDLDAALTGLAATGLPVNDVCGAGSTIAGTSLLTLSSGSLAAGASCTFSVTVQVPGAASVGAHTNTTSQVTGTVGGLAADGAAASDDLLVAGVDFIKMFNGTSFAGGTPVLTFTLDNLSASTTLNGLAFTDDLDAMLSGLVATGLPANDVCGTGSVLSGTSFLTLTNGTLAPGATCMFSVNLQVPASATGGGNFTNTTSDLFESGLTVAPPATAILALAPAPPFGKAFAPDPINVGEISTLTFTIDNSASTLAATGLDFTDNLPAGVTVAPTPNASTTCTGGTLTAVAGSGVVSYTGGSVAAGGTCTAQVDVTSVVPGAHVNVSGALTSSLGSSGTATDTLNVTALSCGPTLTPPALSIPSAGGSGSFLLDTDPACVWTVATPDPEVMITSATMGTGDMTITYDVAANPVGGGRNFSVNVNFAATGESGSHAINQAGLQCLPRVTPVSSDIPGVGGSSSFLVRVRPNCSWTATSPDTAITFTSPTTGNDDAQVDFDVAATPDEARRMTVEVSVAATGETAVHKVNQKRADCTVSLAPTEAAFPLTGGTGRVQVRFNRQSCGWTARPSVDWIKIVQLKDRSDEQDGVPTIGRPDGDGKVTYTVDANDSSNGRNGTIAIGDGLVSVSQAAGLCSFNVTPGTAVFGQQSGSTTVGVQTGEGCAWTAVSNDPWIEIQAGADETGSGSATVAVDDNETGADRTGTVMVGNETVTVTQTASGDGTFVVTPHAVGFGGAGGVGEFRVHAPGSQEWSPTPTVSWITILATGNGSGSDDVRYKVAPNPTAVQRSGKIDLGGRSLTVTQGPKGSGTVKIWIGEEPAEERK